MNVGRSRPQGITTLAERLAGICGTEHVVSDSSTLGTLRGDAGCERGPLPALAVRPAHAGEVAAVVGACADRAVPWVTRGAGTGLSGGALAPAGGVVIVLSRMRRILSVDLDNARVRVEPGVTPLAVSRALRPTHILPGAPVSAGVCTVGGTVATNAGGPWSLKYGALAKRVDGLDVVLADGTLAELRRGSPGLDLLAPFLGSAGAFGVIVAVGLEVVVAPESVRTFTAHFASLRDGAAAAAELVASGLGPTALELLDALALRALAEAGAASPLLPRRGAGAVLVVELDGPRLDTGSALERMTGLCASGGALDLRVALDGAERDRLWRDLAMSYAALGRVMSAFLVADVAVPPSRLVAALDTVGEHAAEAGLAVAHFVRAGEGILHPVIGFDPRSSADAARAQKLGAAIAATAVELGGSVVGEHGAGPRSLDAEAMMFAPLERAVFSEVRGALARHSRGASVPAELARPQPAPG